MTNRPFASQPKEDDDVDGTVRPVGGSHPNAPNPSTPATQRDIFRWDFPVPDGTVVLNGRLDSLGGYQPLDIVLTGTRSAAAQRRLRLLLASPERVDVVSISLANDATGRPSLAVDTLAGLRLGIAPVNLVGHLVPAVEEWVARGWRVLTWASIGFARRPFGEIASEFVGRLAQGKAIPPDFGDPTLSYIDVTLRVPGPDQQLYADAASASSAFPLEAWYGRFSRAEQVRRRAALKAEQLHEIVEETEAACERVGPSPVSPPPGAGFLDVEPIGGTKVDVHDSDRTNLARLFPDGGRHAWVVLASLQRGQRPDSSTAALELRVADLPVGTLPEAAESWGPFVDRANGLGLTPRVQLRIRRGSVYRAGGLPSFWLSAQILADENRHRLFREQPAREAARLEAQRARTAHDAPIIEAQRLRRLARAEEARQIAARRSERAATRDRKDARHEQERLWRQAGLCVGCGAPIFTPKADGHAAAVRRGRPSVRCDACRTPTGR